MSEARIVTVFYIWQSDLRKDCNCDFIEEALRTAAEAVQTSVGDGVQIVIDRDTLGLTGSPKIDAAILEKIQAADCVVADVSIVNSTAAQSLFPVPPGHRRRPPRATPNPNVMFELGFAMGVHGAQRTIMIENQFTQSSDNDHPFDTRSNRRIRYTLSNESSDHDVKLGMLATALESELKSIVQHVITQKQSSNSEVDKLGPVKIFDRLQALAPDTQNITNIEVASIAIEDALDKTTDLRHEWIHYIELLSRTSDEVARSALNASLRELLSKMFNKTVELDRPWGAARTFKNDYWKFLLYEFVVLSVAVGINTEDFEILEGLLQMSFLNKVSSDRGYDKVSISDFDTKLQVFWNDDSANIPWLKTVKLMEDRSKKVGPSIEELAGADFLVYVATRDPAKHHRWPFYTKHLLVADPDWLLRSEYREVAVKLLKALGIGHASQFRVEMRESIKEIQESNIRYSFGNMFMDSSKGVERFATK